jgi:hypothetical protein
MQAKDRLGAYVKLNRITDVHCSKQVLIDWNVPEDLPAPILDAEHQQVPWAEVIRPVDKSAFIGTVPAKDQPVRMDSFFISCKVVSSITQIAC